jgi:stalled ribosome rescue protein Dom34
MKADRVAVSRAHHVLDQPEHMGTPARLGFHTGTRGSPGRDAAQRTLLRGRDRMIAEAVDRAHELAGADGWVVIGGIKRVAARLAQLLTPLAPNRVMQVHSLDVHASEADIAEHARSGASELRDAADDRRIAEIIELAGAHGLGAIGPADALLALEHSSVRDLYVTHRYLEDHAADAERATRAALEQDASVEDVGGRAAERLDEHGGIAAGLRFRASAVAHATATR